MTKKTILFQAAPFCFGPISTTLGVAHALAVLGHRIQIIDEGSCGDLIRRAMLPVEHLEFSSVPPFSEVLLDALRSADLVVSNTDPVFAAAALKAGCKVAVVDTLFWMWDHLDPILREADLLVVQDFLGVDEQIARLQWEQPLVRVGPMIQPQAPPVPREQRDGGLLVSLGGCDCGLVDASSDPYPELIQDLVHKVLSACGGEALLTVGERAAARLRSRASRIAVCTLSNSEHVERIRRARAIMISPGLTGTMEVSEAETPVFFLPPQNYSQVLQLNAYRRAGAAPYSFTWSDVYPEFELPEYLPEGDAVRCVREIIGRFAQDTAAQEALSQCLLKFLAEGVCNSDPAPGSALRRSLGMNGCAEAGAAIQQLLD